MYRPNMCCEVEPEKDLVDSYYMQFVGKVLDVMKTARCALTEAEYKMFIESVTKLTKENIRP